MNSSLPLVLFHKTTILQASAGVLTFNLSKVEELIPSNFEIRKAPKSCRIEDNYLNMKGRRLAPLKTEEIRLVLRPSTKGTFTLKPRIVYIDETGRYKSHDPEPVTVIVKEFGISGWLKGPSR